MAFKRDCLALEKLPGFDGCVMVEMPPDWRSSEPTPYTFVFTNEELSAEDMRRYVRTMVSSESQNPRLFQPSSLALSYLFHPMFWKSVSRGRKINGIPSLLNTSRFVSEPTAYTSGAQYFLQSLLFLTGVTLSAAIVQNRWSPGTIESKLNRLWQAGVAAQNLALKSLMALNLQDLVRQLARRLESPGYKLFLSLKAAFAAALNSVIKAGDIRTITLSPPALDSAMQARFGFVDSLKQLLSGNLEAVVAYGSSVTSETFADYDILLVVRNSTEALEKLAGMCPKYRGVELNLGVYGRSDFWNFQLASGDNLSDHALCLFGEIEVPIKPIPDLLARNYSFGFIRLRQLLGMAAFASGHPLHTTDDDKRNLYGYFVKIPLNVAKGTRGAVGHSITKLDIEDWIADKTDYDARTMLNWCAEERAGDAIASAAWCTQRVMILLNEEYPAIKIVRET
jgi:hypothetical protein